MAKAILVEEFHATMKAPSGLPDAQYRGMRRTLTGARFRRRLLRAVRQLLRQYPSLEHVRATVSW